MMWKLVERMIEASGLAVVVGLAVFANAHMGYSELSGVIFAIVASNAYLLAALGRD